MWASLQIRGKTKRQIEKFSEVITKSAEKALILPKYFFHTKILLPVR